MTKVTYVLDKAA